MLIQFNCCISLYISLTRQGNKGNQGGTTAGTTAGATTTAGAKGTATTGATTPQKKAKKIDRSAKKNNFCNQTATCLRTGHTRVKRLITQHPNISDKNLYLC